MAYATEEQKQRLPAAAGQRRGDLVPAVQRARRRLRSRRHQDPGVRDGDDWIINGQKIWTSGAHYSDWGVIVTRSDPTVAKHKGLTYFFLDMRSPGVEVRPIKQVNGDSGFNEVFFSDVRIPDSQRLGGVGEGWKVSLVTLMNERLSIGAGNMMAGLEPLFELASETNLDGVPAMDHQAVRDAAG
jgi:alkylation response protein AidB-like acyl-CoA dehydrogenase